MGLDANGLLFLNRIYKKNGRFGVTATVGRQGIHLPGQVARRLVGQKLPIKQGDFADELLVEAFGSSTVTSFDNSAYEGANVVLDLNLPIGIEFHEKFDTVLDGGSLEHIFDSKTAIENFSKLVRPGGQIIHITPANNWCGHGFYQFSPEFFFAVYSRERGFSEVEVFLAREGNYKNWYQVKEPQNGQRAEIFSHLPLTSLVRAKKENSNHQTNNPQQSDYVSLWHEPRFQLKYQSNRTSSKLKNAIKKSPLANAIASELIFALQKTMVRQLIFYHFRRGLNSRNQWLRKVKVTSRPS